ncbi:MAG: linear amide C-N hydrolase [Fimbriimonadaceae bacterium]|nr:linear amide C-N hydrolase [Fimbriimonadaceae bacterium]QYK55233.1 MAG: linear amide C-N hydrolase [Fimbriimonadaceae bacterium]
MKQHVQLSLLLAIGFAIAPLNGDACTRLVYKGADGLVLTGRSMDFRDDIPANLWLMPAGVEREGRVGPNSLRWKSKYGSVVLSSFEFATTDGMNEKGLVGNILWLATSEFPDFDQKRKGLAVSLWAQYALDNFATVKEAVDALRKGDFDVVTAEIPGTQRITTVHLSLSDSSGDNAILEYVNGKLTIHHDPDYVVMTNEPDYADQLAIAQYWKEVDGKAMLPGTSRATDRFARASYYLGVLPKTADPRLGAAMTLSVVRNCSVPVGVTGTINLSTTQWRVVSDQKNLIYYFESAFSPSTVWVDLKKLDLKPGTPHRRILLGANYTLSGEVTTEFRETKPFVFAGLVD